MRLPYWFLALPRVTKFLLVLYSAVFAACFLILWRIPATAAFLEAHFVLGPSWWREPWQLLTYSLLHAASFGGLIHLAFGLFWLYWIGRDVEDMRGSAAMFSLWWFSVVLGGIIGVLVAPTLGIEAPAFAGLWGGVIGTMVGVCLWFPDKRIGLFLIGPIRLSYVAAALLLLELLRPASGLASAGAAASAWVFVWLDERGVDMYSWAEYLINTPERVRAYGRAADSGSSLSPDQRDAQRASQAGTDDVDRILDKINAEGMESLTKSERRILEDASRK